MVIGGAVAYVAVLKLFEVSDCQSRTVDVMRGVALSLSLRRSSTRTTRQCWRLQPASCCKKLYRLELRCTLLFLTTTMSMTLVQSTFVEVCLERRFASSYCAL